jgi:hypothetical protein
MDILSILIGVAIIAGGIFAAAFGFSLFRFVLGVLGFMVGYSLATTFTASFGVDPTASLFIGLAAGLILAGIGYAMVNIGRYIAGALLGIVVAQLVLSLLQTQQGGVLGIVGVAAGLGIGAFAGRFFGDLIILTATSFVGAYGIMLGMVTLFPGLVPDAVPGRVPVTLPTLIIMLSIALVGGLAQYNLFRFRRMGMRR